MILIVDDMPEIVEVMQDLVQDYFPNEKIKAFTCPKEALQFSKENHAHIMFVDIVMPGMNGVEFIIEVRHTNACPIVVMSAMGEMVEAELHQFKDVYYLEKPFSSKEFHEFITKHFPEATPKKVI